VLDWGGGAVTWPLHTARISGRCLRRRLPRG